MKNFIGDIQLKLEPLKDYTFYKGLTDPELIHLESQIGKPFPGYFREFLKAFGFRQDFIFGLLTREMDFVNKNSYLPTEIKDSFIVVGDNGGEDFWLLRTDEESDSNLYEWQHWLNGEIVKLGYDLETLIHKNIKKLSRKRKTLAKNDQKFWSVQFSIPTKDEEAIYKTIPLKLVEDWSLKSISPANVYHFEANALLNGNEIIFTKLEYEGWESPRHFFDYEVPLREIDNGSLINVMDEKLKKVFPEYKLIDYSILPI